MIILSLLAFNSEDTWGLMIFFYLSPALKLQFKATDILIKETQNLKFKLFVYLGYKVSYQGSIRWKTHIHDPKYAQHNGRPNFLYIKNSTLLRDEFLNIFITVWIDYFKNRSLPTQTTYYPLMKHHAYQCLTLSMPVWMCKQGSRKAYSRYSQSDPDSELPLYGINSPVPSCFIQKQVLPEKFNSTSSQVYNAHSYQGTEASQPPCKLNNHI